MTFATTEQPTDPIPALTWNLVCRMLGPIYTEAQPHSVALFDWSQTIWAEALDVARERKPLPQVRPPRHGGLLEKSRPSKPPPDIGAFEL